MTRAGRLRRQFFAMAARSDEELGNIARTDASDRSQREAENRDSFRLLPTRRFRAVTASGPQPPASKGPSGQAPSPHRGNPS